jgi:hypothetical protein
VKSDANTARENGRHATKPCRLRWAIAPAIHSWPLALPFTACHYPCHSRLAAEAAIHGMPLRLPFMACH